MPIFESFCPSEACVQQGVPFEWLSRVIDNEEPTCESCGGETRRMISGFAVVFTGPITKKYNDPKSENYDQEGHWAYRKKGTKSGKPEPVFIETFQQQAEFCRAEGLVNPKDTGPVSVGADGRCQSPRGLPGAW